MLAAMTLGADGVQIGSRFAISEESSAHPDFKKLVTETGEGGTKLALKKLAPVRLMKNHFFTQVNNAEQRGATVEELRELLGKGRAKKGMFEGDLENGELEIGQVSAQINQVLPVRQIMEKGMPQLTPYTLSTSEGLIENLATVRQRGFAVSEQELEEQINAVGAPIFDQDKNPIASIAIAGPAYRLPLERMLTIAPNLVATANEISQEIRFSVFPLSPPAAPVP